jgi:hypothetical protein
MIFFITFFSVGAAFCRDVVAVGFSTEVGLTMIRQD